MLATSEGFHEGQQPEPSETEPTPRVLLILATVLERLVARNEKLIDHNVTSRVPEGGNTGQLGANLKVFHGVRAPNISIPKYLDRLYKHTNCSPSCFVVGYVYIDRLVHKHPELLVVSLNVHRLLLTSLMVASKMLDDEQYNNAYYAKIGGVSNVELNKLELELLFLLDFGVTVSSPVFQSYCWHLEKQVMQSSLTNTILEVPSLDLQDDVN